LNDCAQRAIPAPRAIGAKVSKPPIAGLNPVFGAWRIHGFNLIGQSHHECPGNVKARQVYGTQPPNPLPDPFAPNRNGLVGHHLRCRLQAVFRVGSMVTRKSAASTSCEVI
jgi:hypothetical protein